MIAKSLLPAAVLAALLASSPAEAGVSAFFGGLRPAAGFGAAATCLMPSATAISLDEVLGRIPPAEV